MAVRIIQNNFVSGELAPELWGRHDIKAYFNGAASISNFIPRRTGGIRKRPGTSVVYELTAVSNQVGNRYLAFPYMYDNSKCGFVYLYAVATAYSYYTIYAGFIAIANGTTYSVAPSALSISSDLNFISQWELTTIRSKQIGDTIFFTRNRKRAFKCAVSFNSSSPASTTLTFSLMAQTSVPDKPDNLTCTAKNFKFRNKVVENYATNEVYWESYGYVASERKYALYGVKDGIFSSPLVRSVSMWMPWSAGAYIDISFLPNWDEHDYYVLAKMNGGQYGIIGEFYPDNSTSTVDCVYVSADPVNWGTFSNTLTESSIVYMAAPNPSTTDGTPTGVATKMIGDPDQTTPDAVDKELSKYASIYRASSDGTTRTIILPHYYFPNGFAGGRARICLGGSVINSETQAVVAVEYASGTPMALKVTPFNLKENDEGTAGELTYYTTQELTVLTTDGISYVDVDLSAISNTWGPHGADDTIGHIGFKIEYVGADTRMDDCLVLNGVAFDEETSGAFPGEGGLITAEAYDDLITNYDDDAPSATYSENGEHSASKITCAWNDNTGTSLTAINDDTRYASYTADTKTTVSVAMSVYHRNSFIVDNNGAILFTWGKTTDTTTPTSIKLWTGALLRRQDGSIATGSPNPGGASTVKLWQKNTSNAWVLIGQWNVWIAYKDEPVEKNITTSLTDGTNNYKIKFENPETKSVVLRGIALIGYGNKQTYKDDNITSGSITGVQERLTVGDSNMDCRTMDIWQQRLIMASSTKLPFTMWFSTVGDLYNFYANRPMVDSDAFSATIPATKASKILHTVAGKWLTIFTESGEYICESAGGQGFSYRSINIKQVSSVGIHPDIEPIQTEDRIVFVAHDGRSVYEMRFDLSQDSIVPINRSLLAGHLTEAATIVSAAYQRFPDSVVWFLLSDGTMASMTFVPDQEVVAWARHSISQPAGYSAGTLKAVNIFSTGSILSVTNCEPTSEIIIQFDVYNSSNVRQNKTVFERMRPHVATNTPSVTIAKCADHIGITNAPRVTAKLVTLRPESPDFNTQGLPKGIMDVCIRLRRAYAIAVKPSETSMTEQAKTLGSATASTVTLFTGDTKIAPLGYFNDDGQLEIQSDNDKPCEILSAVFTMEVQQ